MSYRGDIDGLRAIAIAVVVAFHVGVPGFDGGFVGVDVFFVISGYLITGLLWDELRRNGSISWSGFYARRVRRLLPAMLVVALVTLVIGVFVMVPDPELRWLGQSVVAVATSLANVFFYSKTSGYFGADAELLPLLNTWSLAVEEQFYLVWPVVLSVGWWMIRRGGRAGRRLAVALVALITVGSLVLSVILVRSNQAAAFYWMPPRLWELVAGGALALLVARIPPISDRLATAVSAVGLALVALSVVLLDDRSAFPGVAAIPVVLGTVLLIGAGAAARSNPVARSLSVAPLVTVGLLSYSWYLIHWPLLVFARLVSLEESLVRDSLIAVGSLGLAALSFRFVEQPFRSDRRRFGVTARATLFSGLGALVVLAVLGAATSIRSQSVSQLAMPESAAAALRENRTAPEACPKHATGSGEAVDCVLGADEGPSLVLVGDSHALALLPAAAAAAEQLGWRLEVLWDTGCPFAVDFTPPAGVEPEDPRCVAENEVRLAHIVEHADDIGAVVMTGRSTSTVVQDSAAATEDAAAAWQRAIASTTGAIADAGVPVLLMLDVPHFEWDVPECTLRRGDCDVAVDVARDTRSAAASAEIAAVEGIDLVRSWDPFEELCDDEVCRATAGRDVLFRDRTHLSEAGARRLAAPLSHQLDLLLEQAERST